MPNESHKLEPVLEHILESQHKNAAEQNRLIEHATEMSVESSAKIAEKISDVAKALSGKKPDEVQKVELVGVKIVTIQGDKGDKGDDGKDADEQKIIDAVSEKIPKKEDIISQVLEKVPKIDDIVAAVVPKIEPGTPGEDGNDGADADPREVAAILKNDPVFIENTKGEPGTPGNDGSPDTGQEIVKKVSSLEGDERLSYNSLKDRPEVFNKTSSKTAMMRSVTFVLESPTSSEVFPIFQVPAQTSISAIRATIRGGTSATFNIDKRTSSTLNTTGTNILASSMVATQSGVASSTFNGAHNIAIPANTFLVLVSSATSGTVNHLVVEIDYNLETP